MGLFVEISERRVEREGVRERFSALGVAACDLKKKKKSHSVHLYQQCFLVSVDFSERRNRGEAGGGKGEQEMGLQKKRRDIQREQSRERDGNERQGGPER